jgi:LuxR family transcriptional regulator, quorum-sensing system regulator BjaR1
MPQRPATFEFLAKCRAAHSVTEIGELLFREMAECGIAHVACASHVDPLNPPPGAVAMVNYPHDWLARFSEQEYARHDPIFWAARMATTPFWWRDLIGRRELRPRQKRILSEARECGIVGGITIPIHSPGALPASCSLVPGSDGFDPLLLPDIQFMALHALEEARLRAGAGMRQRVSLTERQRECLVLAATGKSDWIIGKILGISPRTVNYTLEAAKLRYGVSHRVQAVMRAILDGEINPHELMDVHHDTT